MADKFLSPSSLLSRPFVRSLVHPFLTMAVERMESRERRSAIRTSPLVQCNYFYASRELLSMTATTAGGGGEVETRGDERRRDETRRDNTRRHETRRDATATERRHWFHRGETRRRRQVGPGSVRAAVHNSLVRAATEDSSGKTRRVEKGRRRARRGWDKDRCHWQHLRGLETDRRDRRDWNTWRADGKCATGDDAGIRIAVDLESLLRTRNLVLDIFHVKIIHFYRLYTWRLEATNVKKLSLAGEM